MPQNAPKIQKYAPKCPKTPQNTSDYVLQDYQGVGRRALLPAKPISLAAVQYLFEFIDRSAHAESN